MDGGGFEPPGPKHVIYSHAPLHYGTTHPGKQKPSRSRAIHAIQAWRRRVEGVRIQRFVLLALARRRHLVSHITCGNAHYPGLWDAFVQVGSIAAVTLKHGSRPFTGNSSSSRLLLSYAMREGANLAVGFRLAVLALASNQLAGLRTGAFHWRAARESNSTRRGFGIRPTPCVTTLKDDARSAQLGLPDVFGASRSAIG